MKRRAIDTYGPTTTVGKQNTLQVRRIEFVYHESGELVGHVPYGFARVWRFLFNKARW